MNAPGIRRRIAELFRPRAVDRESVEELRQHIELLAEDKRRAGLDEMEALRQARLEVGSAEAARDYLIDARTGSLADELRRDLGYAVRVLARAPVASALSVLTMAVGIGASAILFALVSGVVLRPLPYPNPDQLVRIFDTNPNVGVDRAGVASGNIDDWRERASLLDGIAGYYTMGRTLSTDADAEVLLTAQVSRDFFDVMAVAPQVGRVFTDEEVRQAQFNNAAAPVGPDPVVILAHGVWRQRFGADPAVVGRSVILDRRPFRIVGVMPERFRAPDAGVQLWIPWDISSNRPRDQHYLGAVARLSEGATIPQAEEQLNAVARQLGNEYPETNTGWGVRLSPLAAETVGETAGILWILLASVAVVLLVACANVALLALLRGLDRADETAVRLALGATSARLLRQFLIESALLAAAGGALGAILTFVGLRLLPSLATDVPRIDEVAIDWRVLAFIMGVTMLAGLVSGLPPAWRRSRGTTFPGIAAGSRRSTGSVEHHWLRDAMAIGQVAMAVVLLAGSGLLLRSFLALREADPGFDPRGVLVAPIFLDTQAYTNGDRIRTYYQTLFDTLSAIPGVVAVGGATTVPTSPLGPDFERPVWPEGVAADPSSRLPAWVRMATPGYFRALGLRVEEGRAFDERDGPDAPRVLMVSATLARRLWPGESAVGKRLVVDYSTAGTYALEVVGVVGDVRFRGPRSSPISEIYLPHAQRSYLIMNVVVKSSGDPRALIAAVRSALREADPQKPAHGIYPLEDLVAATYARDRQAMFTLMVFAGAVLFLAVLSVYGVLSQRVRERTREIGIRVALGADGVRVMAWLAAIGLRMMGWGIAIGLIAAWMITGALTGLLFGVSPNDPLTAAAAVAVLIGVGLLAMVVPSWRATRVDPVTVLRKG